MGSTKKIFDSKTLRKILLFLCLAIIGFAIGIILVNIKNEKQKEEINQTDSTLPEELMEDDLSSTDQVIKKASQMLQDPATSNAEIEKYYDEVIEQALNDGDTDLAIRIIIQKMDFLAVTENDCQKAKEYIENIDLTVYPEAGKHFLASFVISTTAECKDQNLQTKWEEIFNETENG